MARFVALLLVALLAGCATLPPTSAPSRGPAADPTLAAANAAFGARLLREVSEPGQNVVLSPFSVSVALAMALDGAQGPTREAVATTLGLPATDPDGLNARFRDLLLNLTAPDPNATMVVANALWINVSLAPQVNASYLRDARDDYGAEARTEDLRDPATAQRVNAWVSDKTQGRIPKLLQEIRDDEVMLLLDAVYFKSQWAFPFTPGCTHPANFTLEDGSNATVPMMCGAWHGAMRYGESGDLAVARVPYVSSRFAAYLLVPRGNATLENVLAGLDGAALDAALRSATLEGVEVQMPKLDLQSDLDLKPALVSLGMGVAFSDAADFGRIAPALALSRVQHAAMMQVDEFGTVAAAATSVGAVPQSGPPRHLVADRPYLLVLRDDATGSVLFLAKVVDPRAS